MAIRIKYLTADGKRVTGDRQLLIAEDIQQYLQQQGIGGTVQISQYYSDKWYSLDYIRKHLHGDVE